MENIRHGQFQFCGFRLGRTTYAIPLNRVREIFAHRPVTPIPRSPGHIRGLVDFRGKIVASINVAKLLGVRKSTNVGKPMSIIVSLRDSLYCLEVDEVMDVFDAKEKTLNETPGNIDEKIKSFIDGIYKLNNELAIVLNLDKILNADKT